MNQISRGTALDQNGPDTKLVSRRPRHKGGLAMTTTHPTAWHSCCAPADKPPPTRRLSMNITPAERAGSIVLGAAVALAGIVLLTTAGSVLEA